MGHLPDVIDARGKWWTIRLSAPLVNMGQLVANDDDIMEHWQFCDIATDIADQYAEALRRDGQEVGGVFPLTYKFDVEGSVFGADKALYTGTRRLRTLAMKNAVKIGVLMNKRYVDREMVETLMTLLSQLYWLYLRGEDIEHLLREAQKEVDS